MSFPPMRSADIGAAAGATAIQSLVTIGDSVTEGGYDGSPWPPRLIQRAGEFRFLGNFADSGKRLDEILTEQVPLAIASGASHCAIQGGTNDIAQGATEVQMRDRAAAIFTALRAGGVEPISVSLQPVTNVTPAVKAAAHNIWLKRYCALNRITHTDIYPLLSAGGNGGYASNYGYDTLHPSSTGQRVIADAVRGGLIKPFALTPILSLVDDRAFASWAPTAVIANSISFTDTNADGIPDNWNSAGTGGSYSVQNVDSGGYGKWFRCAVSAGTGVGFNPTAQTLASLGWDVGDKLLAAYRLRWVDSSQALTMTARFTGVSAAAGSDVNAMLNEQAGTDTGDDRYIQHEFTIGSGTTIGYQWTANGTGYFEVNRPQIFNLTKLGLT
jgi:lysophospholipase L1-like esterase